VRKNADDLNKLSYPKRCVIAVEAHKDRAVTIRDPGRYDS